MSTHPFVAITAPNVNHSPASKQHLGASPPHAHHVTCTSKHNAACPSAANTPTRHFAILQSSERVMADLEQSTADCKTIQDAVMAALLLTIANALRVMCNYGSVMVSVLVTGRLDL